jgi:hypothetical protein
MIGQANFIFLLKRIVNRLLAHNTLTQVYSLILLFHLLLEQIFILMILVCVHHFSSYFIIILSFFNKITYTYICV